MRQCFPVAVCYGALNIYKTPSQLLRFQEPSLPLRMIVKQNYCPMFDVLFAALALLIIDSAHALVSAPNCSDTDYAWTYNSQEQSPCLVVAYLAAMCNSGSFSMSPLLPQHAYNGPSGPDDGDTCKCNTVAYNLISACDACQAEQWISYVLWSYNCSSVAPPGTFPEPIPSAIRVPYWAYLDPTVNASNYWNASLAQIVGDSPEVTGSVPIPSPTSTGNQHTITPGASSPASSSTTTKSGSNAGAIAGGVVGGVIGVALIAGLIAWFTIHRRRRQAPSAGYVNRQESDMSVVPFTMGTERPKLYNPSDPSTFPTASTIPPSDESRQHLSSSSDLQPNRNEYHGLPEI